MAYDHQFNGKACTREYAEIRTRVYERQDTNACVPIAISILSGHSVEYVLDWLEERRFRRPGKGVKTPDALHCLRTFGCKITEVTQSFSHIKTVSTLAKKLTPGDPEEGPYLIRTSGHMLAVTHGKIHDWSIDRRLRICNVWAVERRADPRS